MIKLKRIPILIVFWLVILIIYWLGSYYQFYINISTSMPQRLWFVEIGNKKLKVDDYVAIKFHDWRMTNPKDYEYVVKQIGGVAGDKVIAKDWVVYTEGVPYPNKTSFLYILNGDLYPVYDELSGNRFSPLTTRDLVIPQGCYFLHGQHDPTFDSRYKEFGLICESQIYGKAHPIF